MSRLMFWLTYHAVYLYDEESIACGSTLGVIPGAKMGSTVGAASQKDLPRDKRSDP